jgi:hypothetical protein
MIKAEPISLLLQHAGEVYGEKSILATEARELQSRLLSLSDERDKSLAILDEVFNILLYFTAKYRPFVLQPVNAH